MIPATPSKQNKKAENKELIQLRKSVSDMKSKLHKSQRKSSSLQAELHNLRHLSTRRRKEVTKLVRKKEDLVKEKKGGKTSKPI